MSEQIDTDSIIHSADELLTFIDSIATNGSSANSKLSMTLHGDVPKGIDTSLDTADLATIISAIVDGSSETHRVDLSEAR